MYIEYIEYIQNKQRSIQKVCHGSIAHIKQCCMFSFSSAISDIHRHSLNY